MQLHRKVSERNRERKRTAGGDGSKSASIGGYHREERETAEWLSSPQTFFDTVAADGKPRITTRRKSPKSSQNEGGKDVGGDDR